MRGFIWTLFFFTPVSYAILCLLNDLEITAMAPRIAGIVAGGIIASTAAHALQEMA